MDIQELENFINYQPIFDINKVDLLVEDIKSKASEYLPSSQLSSIDKAYDFAKKAHQGQKRLSGEPYIVHPVRATQFLMKIKPDIASIQACLLHDVIEDTPYTYEDIKNNFWEEVAKLCQWLVKVSKVRYKHISDKKEAGELRQLETLKKTFLAMWEDLRVIFIKLADRIHNIQTLHYHPKLEKRKRIALETLKIYVPIAQRLGLSVFQWYLENWAFRILNEKEFFRIFKYVKKKYGNGERYIEKGILKLKHLLEENNIKYYTIKGRLKSPYRIYKKLQKYQTKDISKVMDILAFRIITDSISNCYNILWIIHSKYTPIIKKIKDYIAVPKPNGYQSLHTTILWMFDFPVEIQIRTKEMDIKAEYWVAAHFAYKEAGLKPVSVEERQAQWIKKLQDIVKSYQVEIEKEKFKDALQIEILEKNIFVYTPKGDIIELPKGSTVLDFAFRIHTDIGLRFKNALVNWRIVPIDYKLKNWDIVEIKVYKNRYSASKSWLNVLYTPSAKAKLNRFLKQQAKRDLINLWIRKLDEKLKQLWLPTLFTRKDKISKSFSKEELENFLVNIAEGKESIIKFIKKFYPEVVTSEDKNIKAEEKVIKKKEKSVWKNIIIDIDKVVDYKVCPECKPKPGDKIIWRVGKDWIKIHTLSCKALKSISFDKLVEAHWEGEEPNIYYLKIWWYMLDKPWILMQILMIFSELQINIRDIRVQPEKKYKHFIWVNILAEFKIPSKMYYLLKELKNTKEIFKIKEVKVL